MNFFSSIAALSSECSRNCDKITDQLANVLEGMIETAVQTTQSVAAGEPLEQCARSQAAAAL